MDDGRRSQSYCNDINSMGCKEGGQRKYKGHDFSFTLKLTRLVLVSEVTRHFHEDLSYTCSELDLNKYTISVLNLIEILYTSLTS